MGEGGLLNVNNTNMLLTITCHRRRREFTNSQIPINVAYVWPLWTLLQLLFLSKALTGSSGHLSKDDPKG